MKSKTTKEVSRLSFFYRLLNLVPIKNKVIAFIFSKYVDYCKNENNIDMYSNGELDFFRKKSGKFKVVFDIGANIGEWTIAVKNIKNDVVVHAFEPSCKTYNRLSYNLSDMSGVFLNKIAIGSKKGNLNMYIYENEAGINSFYKREGVKQLDKLNILIEKVRVDTVDNYIASNKIKYVDLVKIDVEGHEFHVIDGMRDSLSKKNISYVQFEYGGTFIDSRFLLKDIFDIAKKYNYHMYKLMQKDVKLFDRYDQKFENFQYSNWVMSKDLII